MDATGSVPVPEAAIDPVVAAHDAGLRYVHDASEGFRRVKSGRSFRYLDTNGRPVTEEHRQRIASLVIPPAWTNVWICPDPRGHLQATGKDARGRKQYRYHPEWRRVRDSTKFEKMIAFAKALPAIRAHTAADLKREGLPREKVLATVVQLLEKTLIRVGNEEYAKDNGSYGLTTMKNRHVDVRGSTIRFHFKGKSGVKHEIAIDDPRLARVVGRCEELPGQDLFEFIDDDGAAHPIGSADVNEYLHEIAGEAFTAKDFRTWAGTVLASRALLELEATDSPKARARNVAAAIERVAARLGNTRAVCRKCYVHPAVLESYLDGTMMRVLSRKIARAARGGLPREEAAVLALLSKRMAREAASPRRKKSPSLATQLRRSVRAAKAVRRASRRRPRSSRWCAGA